MKKLLILCFAAILMLFAGQVRGQELTQAEKDKAMAYLESTKKAVHDAVRDLSPAQLNFKSAPDRWSIAQCLEHIAATEDTLRGLITDQVMKSPAAPDRDVKKIDEGILAMIPDRSHKAQAPEALKPTERFGSPEGSMKHFIESRAKTEDLLKNTPDLRQHAMDSPLGMKLDGYDWILFIAAHSERHTKQINEVKSDPSFPKS